MMCHALIRFIFTSIYRLSDDDDDDDAVVVMPEKKVSLPYTTPLPLSLGLWTTFPA